MKTQFFILIVTILLIYACRDRAGTALPCKEITPGVLFEAKVHETWCLPDESVKLSINSIVEDSRCNVKDIVCVWAGRAVLELLIETKEIPSYRDTFYAVENWQDTLSIGNYDLELALIHPQERLDTSVDTAAYRFQMILK
jgi:hypothetical protein